MRFVPIGRLAIWFGRDPTRTQVLSNYRKGEPAAAFAYSARTGVPWRGRIAQEEREQRAHASSGASEPVEEVWEYYQNPNTGRHYHFPLSDSD